MLMMAAVVIFTMTSCSDDDPAEPVQDTTSDTMILLKRTVVSTTNPDVGVRVARYYYDGNKLTDIAYSNGNSEEIAYEGDFITRWDKFTGSILTENIVYEYDAQGQLISDRHELSTNVVYTNHYVHNADQTISYTRESSDTPVIQTGQYDYQTTVFPNQSGGTSGYVVDIDDKNNPVKNVAGLHRIYFTMDRYATNTANNVTAIHNINNGVYVNTRSRTTYIYNENNYPVASERTEGFKVTTQYFYE